MNFKWIRTRKKSSLWRVGLLLIAVLSVFVFLLGSSNPAVARDAIEICDNEIDDDGDGFTDETNQNGGCHIGPGTPVSGDGITPEEWTDNPSCEDIGYLYGFKIEGQGSADYTGTFTFTLADGVLTGGAPSDPNNSVTLSSNGYFLNWSSTIPLDAVIMKGGPNSNVYIYEPEDSADTALAPPNEPSDDALSHVEFCYDYDLIVTKDAAGSYDRTISWELEKTVNPETHSGFIGDSFNSTWKVVATKNVVEDNYLVTGSITIDNPSATDVDFAVEDVIDGSIYPAVSCPEYTVPAGGQIVCTYTADGDDGIDGTQTLNEVTVTSLTPGVGGDSDDATISFTATVFGDESVTVDDDRDTEGQFPAEISDTTTFDYVENFSCSTTLGDYTNGIDSDNYPNTATLTGDNTNLSDDADVDVTCYIPLVDKDASASYDERHDWNVIKTVDPESQSAFAGDPVNWTWTVEIEETVVDENFSVTGDIYVTNPAGSPGNMLVDLADVLDDGTVATVDCGGGETSVSVAPGATESCAYSASPTDASATENTATGTFNGIDFVTTEPFSFVTNVVNDSATFSDPYLEIGDTVVTDPSITDYPEGDVCSSDQADYGEDGKYTVTLNNIAYLVDEEGTQYDDDATTAYTCYAPLLDKDASAGYDERWTWTLEKTVFETENSGYPGDFLDWTWTVTVGETYVDENFSVTGNIDVSNPAGSPGNMTVDVADQLSDGTIAIVDCGGSATSVIVAPGTTESCSYSASPTDASATENTATGTFNGIDFVTTEPFTFVKTVVNGTATVDDDQEPDFPVNLVAGDGGTRQWTETQDHTCSTSWADYGADGTYSATLTNDATLTSNGGQNLQAHAETTYTCEAGTVEVLKYTNGVVNSAKDWQFALYLGPDGFGGTQVGSTSSTLGDADGILDFGDPALRPDTTYTVCELGVPAGWTSQWQVDLNGDGVMDAPVIPYNPNADDDPPEDLGNRCVDFGAGTTIPVTVGTEIRFQVDNNFPGGAPRTPGYWKNWNRCTNGGQQYTADANGGWEEGYWLLEDVLDPAIGGGIVWDDILDDSFEFPITECAVAVDILDKRAIGDPLIVGDGKKEASDPLHNLATHLLAAQLNFGAGACTTQEVLDAALAAETLLDKYNFDGNGHDNLQKKDPDADLANQLAGYLDAYNNGEFCGDGGD